MEMSSFRRHRRLRSSEAMRGLVRETELTPAHLVYPLFIEAGLRGRAPIAAMPGQDRLGLDALAAEARELAALRIPAVLLFGLPPEKDERGSGAWASDGIVQQAARTLKDANPTDTYEASLSFKLPASETLQLVSGARELAEHQGSGIVDSTGHILFGNQVHAVSKRSDEHHIGGEIERHHLFS